MVTDGMITRSWIMLLGATGIASGATPPDPSAPAAAPAAPPVVCLASGDGYLKAHLGGAVETDVDWPNSGTLCQGESRQDPPGVRLSFARATGSSPDLLFVFGITGVREGKAAHALGVNLTVFVQGSSEVYGTQGDSRCSIDSLSQRLLVAPDTYRLEARGFCTQPAHAVRGSGALLVNRFDFAGTVSYARDDAAK